MRKALFLILFSGQAIAMDCGNVFPGHPDFARCVQIENAAKNRPAYVPQPVYIQPQPVYVQPMQIPVLQGGMPMQSNQIKQTECRAALGGGINCTTY